MRRNHKEDAAGPVVESRPRFATAEMPSGSRERDLIIASLEKAPNGRRRTTGAPIQSGPTTRGPHVVCVAPDSPRARAAETRTRCLPCRRTTDARRDERPSPRSAARLRCGSEWGLGLRGQWQRYGTHCARTRGAWRACRAGLGSSRGSRCALVRTPTVRPTFRDFGLGRPAPRGAANAAMPRWREATRPRVL
jgi:hypothetical protein